AVVALGVREGVYDCVLGSDAEREAARATVGVDVAGDACAGVRLAGRQPRVALAVVQALDAAVMGLVADLPGSGARVPRRGAGAVFATRESAAELASLTCAVFGGLGAGRIRGASRDRASVESIHIRGSTN